MTDTSAFNPDDYGESCARSRWFRGEMRVVHEQVVDRTVTMPCFAFDGTERYVQCVAEWHYIQRWLCPNRECAGEMKDAGWMWPTFDPGHHHTCSECGFTAAIKGCTYPRRISDERGQP